MNADLKNIIHDSLIDVWKTDSKMIDYCEQTIASACQLPNGMVLTEDTQKIEKSFYFGWSSCGQGPDYADAMRSERNARNNEDYFLAENLKAYDEEIKHITEDDGWYPILRTSYPWNSSPENPLRTLEWHRATNIINRFGEDAMKQGNRFSNEEYRDIYTPTADDLKLILSMLQEARAKHEKKCKAYLKRYGVSKIKTHTYWIDD